MERRIFLKFVIGLGGAALAPSLLRLPDVASAPAQDASVAESRVIIPGAGKLLDVFFDSNEQRARLAIYRGKQLLLPEFATSHHLRWVPPVGAEPIFMQSSPLTVITSPTSCAHLVFEANPTLWQRIRGLPGTRFCMQADARGSRIMRLNP